MTRGSPNTHTTILNVPAADPISDPLPHQVELMTPPSETAPEAAKLSPEEQMELRSAFTEGGTERVRDFWVNRNSRLREDVKAAEAAENAATEAMQPRNTLIGPKAGETTDGPSPDELKAADAKVREMSDGAVTVPTLEQLSHLTGPFVEQLDAVAQEGGEEAVIAEIERGEAQVLSRVYSGNPDALGAGVNAIRTAVERMFGDRAASVMWEIDESGILASPTAHWRILKLAERMGR